MPFSPFNFLSPKHLAFGPGKLTELPAMAARLGCRIILVTGKSAFRTGPAWERLMADFSGQGAQIFQATIPTEPSPEMIDAIVRENRENAIDLVIAVGGGAVLDAGKAVSAMMGKNESVMEFLEGVGKKSHNGEKLPFFAVPTTSGTGSEATKNAVISRPGPSGFKKSLRHDNFIPDLALIDPALTLTCPARVTAACGMDALTQLLEAYVSKSASPVTDALCRDALTGFGAALSRVLEGNPLDLDARSRLSYGAYISGLALANAGLGTVHGFASVIGGLAENRHGEVCGTLLAETTRATIERLEQDDPGHPALAKYADGALRLGLANRDNSISKACGRLIEGLSEWTRQFKMPGLAACGITPADLAFIAGRTGQKNNPVQLSEETLVRILESRR